jgi:hypothetical protein
MKFLEVLNREDPDHTTVDIPQPVDIGYGTTS